ncbi:MAG: CvpA family protein [Clostridia bacterium]|nr:CvpA family protein [Clostridia bacterium]
MWSYIIDGLLILILIVCTIVGIAKGLFDSILGLISTGLALVISAFTAKYIANLINKLFNFEDFILKKLDGKELSIFGHAYTPSDIAKFCVWICSLVIMFLLIKFVIFILAKVFESVTKTSPTISGVNRVLGMVFGLAKGCVIVVSLLALCSIITNVPAIGAPVYEKISDTKITNSVFKFVDEFVEKNINHDTIQDIIDRIKSESSSKDDSSKEEESTQQPESSGGTELATNNYYIEYTN